MLKILGGKTMNYRRASFIKNNKGQMKIQEMSFVLVAIMIFFGIALLIFLKVTLGNLGKDVVNQRAEEANELVRKLSETPEFSFTSFGDCSGCIDMDKALALKERKNYLGFWNLEYIQFETRYPLKTGECTRANYPDCGTITIGNNSISGEVRSSFAALCRVDFQYSPFSRCDLGMIHASGKSLDSYISSGGQ
jgi:hypothetical protein